MKKCISLLLSVLMCITVFLPAATAFAADGDLTIDAAWKILVPASPTSYETWAAEKLRSVISEALGAQIETVSSADSKYIAVGAASSADVSDVAVNGYRIQAIDGNLHLNGTGERGLQVGAVRLLEEFFGRKVYAGDQIVLPKAESVTVPADADITYEPFFEYADTDWRSPRNWEYSIANGMTGGTYRRLPAEMGGTVDYIEGFCHTMGGLCETASYKDSHPEYLALHNGERTVDQPCLTNPDVLEIAKRNVLAKIARNYDPSAAVQIVSVTQNDNYNYCECENCKAFEAAHGGVQSATMINFVNQIADAVKAAGYENTAIDTFAYQYTRQAPTGIVPRDNVIVRLCTIECCFRHTLDDPSCERNVALMKDLSDWAKICDRIYVWDYTTNYSNTVIVFPDFGVIQRNIQVFYENNVKGVYEEGNYYIDWCDAEFGDLRAYMLSKCLQDPYCDLDSEVAGFLAAYYGPGWENVKKIIDMHVANAGDHVGIGAGPSQSVHFTNREIVEINALWAAAKNAAENETQTEHIGRSELSWRFWKACVRKDEFSILNPKRFDENQKLFEDLQAYGVQGLNEGGYGDYLDCICVRYVPANEWTMYEADESAAQARLKFSKFLEKITPLLTLFGLYYKIYQAIYNK